MPSETKILELRKLSKDRVKDAKILLGNNRIDGAKYICGYAVECILKYKICRVLSWETYPPTNPSGNGRLGQVISSLKTHNLEVLLLLTGEHKKIFTTPALSVAWNDVRDWDSEIRYQDQPASKSDIRAMIESVCILMRHFGAGPV